MTKRTLRLGGAGLLLACSALLFTGCPAYGPRPETVDYVDLERYAGLWHEIASNPVFFNQGLVGVTAEYTLRDDGKVDVFNRGFEGSLDGPEDSIEGVARVVDTETNSKLGVTFGSGLARFFEGEYWIVLLDDENYEYAVVTDSRQFTLFILYREPAMPEDLFNAILDALEEAEINVSRLDLTGELS